MPLVSAEIFINEFYPNPPGKDNLPMPEGEWVELYNDGSSMDLLGYYLVDNYNRKVYITDITGGTKIDDYLVVYMNGKFGFLNNDGIEKIYLKNSEDEEIDSVSYAHSSEGLSWSLADGRWIETYLTPGKENYNYLPVEESSIKIEKVYLGSDDKAKFGDIVRVKVNIYKGGTSKYAVYARVKDLSKRTQINLHNKYTNYTVTLPIQINSNCDEYYDDDDYSLEVFGLDAEDETEIEISGINKKLCQYVDRPVAEIAQKRFEYEILEIPPNIKSGEQFFVSVLLKNNYDRDLPIKIWSYVYRGSKSYSGERDANMKEFMLPAGGEMVVELSNVFEGKSGQYKHKVLINKDNQKTNQQLVSTLNAVADKKCPVCSCSNNKVPVTQMVMSGYEPVVYESTSATQQKVAPMLLSVVGLLGFMLTFKYEKTLK